MSFASVQDENVKSMLQFTYKLLKTTRPLLTDEEIKIIAEDMVFRAGVKAATTNHDVFKFGVCSQDKPDIKPRRKRATLVVRESTDEEKLQKEKAKNHSVIANSTPNEPRVSFSLITDRKRVYSTASINSSIDKSDSNSSRTQTTNVFERLYSQRRKPSEKSLEIVQKVREEEKAIRAAKGEPEIKKKKTFCIVTDDEKLQSTANSSIFKNLSSINRRPSNNMQSFNEQFRQSFKRNQSISRRNVSAPNGNDEPIYISSSSSTVSATSDYQSGDLMDEVQFDHEMSSMHKKLEKLSVRYNKNLSLCQIDIDLV